MTKNPAQRHRGKQPHSAPSQLEAKISTPPIHAPLPAELKSGYRSFKHGRFPTEWRLFQKLGAGQHPNTLVIGCVDSRASPEIIFDAAPGDIFVVRNISALVPAYGPNGTPVGTSAGLEYAVKALNVAHIVVLGHSGCGGIRACAEKKYPQVCACGELKDRPPKPKFDYVDDWVKLIEPIANRIDPPASAGPGHFDVYCEGLCKETIKEMLQVLRGYPWVSEKECFGKLSLHGAYFSIEDGQLYALDQTMDDFVPV